MHFLKKYIWIISILFSLVGFAKIEEVSIDTKDIHVPKGFDSNDDVEVVITGNLPDTCYRKPMGLAKFTDGRINIEVKATKIEEENTLCIKALIPYVISVPLGRLNEGNYSILVNPGSGAEKKSFIKVEESNSNSIDDYTYANVTSVKREPNTNTIVIQGYHPSSCMVIDRIELIKNDTDDTISVLPIIKQTEPICDCMVVPFEAKIQIPEFEKNKLIHVRKISGGAINYVDP